MASISFSKCNNAAYKNISQEEVAQYLQSLKENDIMQLHQQFEKYIKSEFHKSEQCVCESNDIGSLFADCIKDSVLVGKWTGLHIAVSDNNSRYKKQAIDAFVTSFPELLFTQNNKGQTPLMLAANMNTNIIIYLLDNYIKTSDDKSRAKLPNSSGDSVLTFSFNLKEPRKRADAEDASIYLIKNLYDDNIDIMTFKKAVLSKNCPNEVIVNISLYLTENITVKQLSDILVKLILKTDMDVSQFSKILSKVESLSPYSFNCHEAMYTKAFNILKDLSKFVKKGDDQTATLFTTFYTNFLKYSPSCVCPDDQKNIAHFACQEDNIFLLEVLAKKFQEDFLKMMKQYDSDNKRPVYYCRKPIQIINKLNRLIEDPQIWAVLCKDNRYNIVHQIFRRSVNAKDFDQLFELDSNFLTTLLQNCDNNGDSALHIMLRIRCKSSLLQLMVGKFIELNISVDVRNNKGMTPLFVLCSFLNLYDDLDIPIKLVETLLEAGADNKIIIGSEVLSQLSAQGRLITAEWLARMSIQTAKDPESLTEDLETFLPKIKRSPHFEDGEFEPDDELFEKLRSHVVIRYSHQLFKMINLIGPYSCTVFPGQSIVCVHGNTDTLFYSCVGIQPSNSVTYVHKTVSHFQTSFSVIANNKEEAVSYILLQKDKLQTLSKKQINLLTLLKTKMGLSYLHLPTDLLPSEPLQQDISFLLADDSVSHELGYDLGALNQDLDILSKLGLIRLVRDEEGVHNYVVNIPFALTQCHDEQVRALLYRCGIPTNIIVGDATKETKSKDCLLNITTSGAGRSCEYLLKPLSDTLTYLLSGTLAKKKDCHCYHVRLTGKTFIELRVSNKDIVVSTNSPSLQPMVRYAIQIAIHQLNHGNLGAVKNENTLELKLPGNGEGGDVIKTSTAAPLLPGSAEERGEVQTDKKLSSCLVKVVGVWHLKKLFQMMKEDGSIKIPVDEARAPLKSDIETVKSMRLFSELVSEHGNTNLINFYNTVKMDPKNDPFCKALLAVLDLEEDHMKTRLDSCQENGWWVVTAIIAAVILIVTIVTSVLYDVDGGFGGIAGVPLVFIASYFLKRILVRDEQTGKFKPWKDQEILEQCKGCMA